MSNGPFGPWPSQPEHINTIEEAYEAMRLVCDRMEVIMERDQNEIPHKMFKRCDKAVVLIKAGFKIVKKAIGYKKPKLRVVA